MIKYRSSISTHFADFNKMELETQTELDELVAITNTDYLVQVNRWLVRTIHCVTFPDGHIPTTDTNKMLDIVEGPMTQKILNGEAVVASLSCKGLALEVDRCLSEVGIEEGVGG
jgi:hypothetical protein